MNNAKGVILAKAANQTSSCQPQKCLSQCNPTCLTTESCVLDVMQNCDECPTPRCVSLVSIGSQGNGSTTTGPNVPLIAGLTGGLVGAALVAGIIVFIWFFRRRRRRSNLSNSAFSNNAPSSSTTAVPHDTKECSVSISMPNVPPTLDGDPMHVNKPDHVDQPPATLPLQSESTPASVDPSTPSQTAIRQSLSIAPSALRTGIPQRSSSLKVTKHDFNSSDIQPSGLFEDLEDEGAVTLRRAVSVKKQGGPLTRSASVRSVTKADPANSTDWTQESEPADVKAVHLVRVKPTMVKINTITRKEGKIIRKRSVRTVISPEEADEKGTPPTTPSTDPTPDPDPDTVSETTLKSSHSNDAVITVENDTEPLPASSPV